MTPTQHAVAAWLVALSLLGAQVSADLFARVGADVNGLALFALPALVLWVPWLVVHVVTGRDPSPALSSASGRETQRPPATIHPPRKDPDAARPARPGAPRPGQAASGGR